MKKFGLIGEKLGHSYSPLIHSKFGEYDYDLIEVTEDELKDFLQSSEYEGFNVTIPYKKKVMEFCDEISDKAKDIGSVNTIVRRADGKLAGYNTDYYGFTYLLKVVGVDVKDKKCIVLGSGGASLTVQAVLRDLGAESITVVSRKGEVNYSNVKELKDTEVIVNTTPVGMYPANGVTPINISDFPNCEGVVDVIYNPNKTKLVFEALEREISATGGLEMLVAQAAKASEIFTGTEIEEEMIENVIDEVRTETSNTILIGMPGAGKTFLGREIAARMGRKFVDIDDLIEEREGMTIPEIFAKKGEGYFRKVESKVLEEACIQRGLVIATGGGIVKVKENYKIIKQNGVVIWVKRDLDKLETEGRPLSMTIPVEQLFEERKEAYSTWSDFYINNNEERE